VLRARRMRAHSLVREHAKLLEDLASGTMQLHIEVNTETGETEQSFRMELPPEEAFESFAARVRPFTMRKEPVYWEHVVSNEVGDPYSPAVLSRYWRDAVKAAGVRHIKLHAARHTAATLMHLSGVPTAVVAAWIGHKDASLTLRLYAHSQDGALKAAAGTFDRVGTLSAH
jgi:integrase